MIARFMSFYKPGVTTRAHATWECAFCKSFDYCIVHRVAHNCCTFDKHLCHSLRHRIYHLVVTLRFRQWLEGWKIKLLDYVTRSGDALRLEEFMFKSFHELKVLLLLIFFELVFINRDVVAFIDFRLITKFHHVEASGPTEHAKRCVDAKINTLESEGK